MDKSRPPDSSEYNPYYAPYVSRVGDEDVLEALSSDLAYVQKVLGPLTEKQAAYRYAADKWSIKQIVGHLIDSERVFTYRALRFARGDDTPLPGMEQDDFVAGGAFDERALSDLLEEFAAVRTATIHLFTAMNALAWMQYGIASGYPFSVRALAHITAGHVRHHMAVLEARYLPQLPQV